MNKSLSIFWLISATLLISGCSEKTQFEDAVLAELKNEPDIKDYKLDPAAMAGCVASSTAQKMPGIFPGDPERLKAYVAYTKLITLKSAKDPQKAMDELRKDFGSAQGLLEARNNYTQSLVECQTTMVTNTEAAEMSKEVPAVKSPDTAKPAGSEKPAQ